MSSARAWISAARPKTLTAAVVPVTVGSTLALAGIGWSGLWSGGVRWEIPALALGSALLIQIATNFFNDVLDFKRGADTPDRTGPRRALLSGDLTERQVFGAAIVMLVAAVALGIPLVLRGGWPIVAIGLVSVALAYAYTGGPYPLAYRGLGDLFVFIFFGLIAVGGAYYLQAARWNPSVCIAGAQIGLLATVLIAINNLRDREGDARAGKRTLAVRLGVTGSRVEILLLSILPYGLNLYWLKLGMKWPVFLPFITLPLALRLVMKVWLTEPGPAYNALLGRAAGVHLLFGLLLSAGFLLG